MALSAADSLVNKDGKLELDLLRRLQPVQLSEEWGDMVVPRRRKHHRLEPIELVLRNADEGGVSVVQPRQNERRYQ